MANRRQSATVTRATAAPSATLAVALRRDWPRWASLGLAVLGIFVAGYLTWVKLADVPIYCGGSGQCETVNQSVYANINGFPVAALGLGAYFVIAAALALEDRAVVVRDYGPLAVFGLALTGTLYSAYLTYIELFVIHAVCPYCVVSAVLITGILILSVVRLARGGRANLAAG